MISSASLAVSSDSDDSGGLDNSDDSEVSGDSEDSTNYVLEDNSDSILKVPSLRYHSR